jgi:hypothetical protein
MYCRIKIKRREYCIIYCCYEQVCHLGYYLQECMDYSMENLKNTLKWLWFTYFRHLGDEPIILVTWFRHLHDEMLMQT